MEQSNLIKFLNCKLTNMKMFSIFQQNTLSLYLTIILTLTGYKTFTTRAWKERMKIIGKLILIIPTCDASPSSVGPRFILAAMKDSLHEAAAMPGHVRIESGAVYMIITSKVEGFLNLPRNVIFRVSSI